MSSCAQRTQISLVKGDKPRELGLWIEAIGSDAPISNSVRLEKAILDAKALGVTDLYLQVYRQGQAWFKSSFAQSANIKADFDPLALALERAHENGLKVHAWINVFNLHESKNQLILNRIKSDILLRDNLGVSVKEYDKSGLPEDQRAKYFQLDSPGLWLDPANEMVKLYLSALVSELLKNYPRLDGIHLDFFRYPYLLPMKSSSSTAFGFEFGYGKETIAQFESENNLSNAFMRGKQNELKPKNYSIAILWDRWRRENLRSYLNGIRQILNSKQELSLAALAWNDRAYFTSYQNWPAWLMDGAVDKVILMAYTRDMEQYAQLVRAASAFKTRSSHSKLIAGIGAYLFTLNDQNGITQQIHSAKENGADGAALFSYKNLKKSNFDFNQTLID